MRGEWIEIKAAGGRRRMPPSLPMRGEWIEMHIWKKMQEAGKMSLPMRGEWIEMASGHGGARARAASLPMRGEWIEITFPAPYEAASSGLSPCGESGLKWVRCSRSYSTVTGSLPASLQIGLESLPMRGEWIEITWWSGFRQRIAGLSPCGESGLKCTVRR